MTKTGTTPPRGKGWRWVALGTLGIVGAAGGWYGLHYADMVRAQTQQAPLAQLGNAPVIPVAPDTRVVGFINANDAVSREELANYLIVRRGAEKLDAVINHRIIDFVCQSHNVTVTTAEVETALSESIHDLGFNRQQFLNDYLKGIHKTLLEWKEDVLRPKLMLSKLCRGRVVVKEEEIHQAFESQYGEKVQCRLIVWPNTAAGHKRATELYASLRDSEDAFARAAKTENPGPLASTGGKIRPVGRYTLSDRTLEEKIFKLRPGEVSELFEGKDEITLVKCDGRIPADTSKQFEAAREELTKALYDRKLGVEAGMYFQQLRKEANITPAFSEQRSKAMVELLGKPGEPGQVVATIYNNVPITRRDLGEYLIERYGAASMELLLNRKVIDNACTARSIAISDAELDTAYKAELAQYKLEEKDFIAKVLKPRGVTFFQWKEDVLRPRLMMAKLVGAQVKVTDEELKKAYNAYYGETVAGQLIVWQQKGPMDILRIYTDLRDSDAKFDAAAHQQSNPALAATGGNIGPFARNTTGYPQLEEEAFKLQPGQVSSLIETREGLMIFKCKERKPPNTTKTFEDARAELTPIAREKLIEKSIPSVFEQLKAQANPRSLLKDYNTPEDLAASVQHSLNPTMPGGGGNRQGFGPKVN